MTDHKASIMAGEATAVELHKKLMQAVDEEGGCPHCFLNAVVVVLLGEHYKNEPLEQQLEIFSTLVSSAISYTKRRADQPDPPESPDKRLMN